MTFGDRAPTAAIALMRGLGLDQKLFRPATGDRLAQARRL